MLYAPYCKSGFAAAPPAKTALVVGAGVEGAGVWKLRCNDVCVTDILNNAFVITPFDANVTVNVT